MTLRDPYATLGVPRTATAEEIKKAYRRLAKRHHPDVNPGDKKSEERFKDVSGAFDVLGDPKRRALWDEFGELSTRPGFDEAKARAYRDYQRTGTGGEGGGFEGFSGFPGFDPNDLGDLFGDVFARRRQAEARRRGPPPPEPGADAEGTIEVPLRDAVLGAEREVTVDRPARCPTCFGLGSRPDGRMRPCGDCEGTGEIRRAGGILRAPCQRCGGSGKQRAPCERCGGSGQAQETAHLKVKVPPGVVTGSRIRLSGQGAPGARGGGPGDLYLTVRLREHAHVRVEGRDLTMDLPVTVGEALLGGEVTAPTFEGPVKLKIPAGSQSGRKLRLRGRGLPALRGQGDGRGDLYVVLQINLPPDSEAAREAAERLEDLYEDDPRRHVAL